MSQTFVVVGAGLAAAHAITGLREAGFDGRIVLYGEEHHLPYERPPLSKGYLLGDDELDSAFVHPPEWYDQNDVDLRLGTPVTALDTAKHRVQAGDLGEDYDRLLLATGARPRRMAMADDSGAPVAYLRTIEDSQRLKAEFSSGRRVAIVGGGWIGLEVASAARRAGAEVTVLEALDQPLLRVLGPQVAKTFAELHREHGVDLRTGVRIESIERAGERATVSLAGGDTVEADLVVVGVGVSPNDGLATKAGLDVDNGILVDARLTTSDPDVFAAGDVANAEHPTLGHRIRVEHWETAIEHGKHVARTMLGEDAAYDRMPYFFTDQYDLGMEYVGSLGPEGPDGVDEVVIRGDLGGDRVFTAFWVKDGRVLAGMHANDWDAGDALRALAGRKVDVGRLRDVGVPLADLTG
ncbi:MAG TPA: FAD-dependent oxidoreductase [Nocardioidaceae bacterium]|nr:FAD-dependent oxidoreductase [Nocardioidaceae bacterium]